MRLKMWDVLYKVDLCNLEIKILDFIDVGVDYFKKRIVEGIK
jgi:hypothetical protein